MYIEELVEELSRSRHVVNDADMAILQSFSDQYFNGTGFTEKQSVLAIRIIKRYESSLSSRLKTEILPFLENPNFKLKIRKSVLNKSVNIIDGNIIEVKFPYSDEGVKAIREFKAKHNNNASIVWDKDTTAWHFPISEQNIKFISDLCSDDSFTFSEDFQNYADTVENIINNAEQYAPMLSIINGELKIQNSPKNMPEIETDDILEAVFQARNLGVTLWDDHINEYLNSSYVQNEVKNFLIKDTNTGFHLDPTETGISALKTIIKHNGPTLIIIPGGDEYNKTLQVFDILKGIGIPEKNMSILFRLPSETGRKFNDFVKNQGLNGPISSETKVVFISAKLPKPLLKSKIKFNTIVNTGYAMAHYTLKEYTKNHQNFINFGVKQKYIGFDFGYL